MPICYLHCHILYIKLLKTVVCYDFVGYWHQVRSYGAKNLAITMLFSRIKSFNGSNCASKKVDFTPLSETGMVWTYPGYGPQTLGNLDPFELRYVEDCC